MILGSAILVLTILYSNFLADSLKKNEEKNIPLINVQEASIENSQREKKGESN